MLDDNHSQLHSIRLAKISWGRRGAASGGALAGSFKNMPNKTLQALSSINVGIKRQGKAVPFARLGKQ